MASNTTNGETKQIRDNLYAQKNISSDNNANPNKTSSSMKSTGAIPKTKVNTTNVPNGIPTEARLKLNNNMNDNMSKSDVSGTEQYVNTYSDVPAESSTVKSYSKALTNGFKSSPTSTASNQLHNGSVQFSVCAQTTNKDQYSTNSSNSSSDSPSETLLNGIEYGPSTSNAFNNIRLGAAQKSKDTESECSSDTGNDDLSCSDECCIYTYKGDVADLPRSFMNLDTADNNDAQDHSRAGSRGSSPEMDFLEMDFDPGPSCDADSDASSIKSDLRNDENVPENDHFEQSQPPVTEESSSPQVIPEETATSATISSEKNNLSPETTTATTNNLVSRKKEPELRNSNQFVQEQNKQIQTKPQLVNLVDEPWIPKLHSQRTVASILVPDPKGYHRSSGDLFSPNDNVMPSTSALDCRVNTSCSLYHSTMEKELMLDKQPTTDEEHVPAIDKTMIWTEQEAALKQVTQIGTSACGATAVLNVLSALGYPLPTNEQVFEAVPTRLRATSGSLVQYLKSRSVAGSTHKDLIAGLTKLSNGKVYAKFFHMYPERYINLSQWLSYWIKKGAVPIATLNLQNGLFPGDPIPDSWHHQMIFGVGPHGIYLTNPLERIEEGELWYQLSSKPVLLVRREDIICRSNDRTNLKELMYTKGVQWKNLNVLGQVANVIREHQRQVRPNAVSRTHVCIPVAYSSGMTLAMDTENPSCELLQRCPGLPVFNRIP